MSDPILSFDDVTVQFGGVRACDSISGRVERGSLFALIGPNGAGKTTLVNAISGVYKPLPGARVQFHPEDKKPTRRTCWPTAPSKSPDSV